MRAGKQQLYRMVWVRSITLTRNSGLWGPQIQQGCYKNDLPKRLDDRLLPFIQPFWGFKPVVSISDFLWKGQISKGSSLTLGRCIWTRADLLHGCCCSSVGSVGESWFVGIAFSRLLYRCCHRLWHSLVHSHRQMHSILCGFIITEWVERDILWARRSSKVKIIAERLLLLTGQLHRHQI